MPNIAVQIKVRADNTGTKILLPDVGNPSIQITQVRMAMPGYLLPAHQFPVFLQNGTVLNGPLKAGSTDVRTFELDVNPVGTAYKAVEVFEGGRTWYFKVTADADYDDLVEVDPATLLPPVAVSAVAGAVTSVAGNPGPSITTAQLAAALDPTYAQLTAVAATGPGRKWVFLGDSHTDGTGTSNIRFAFPRQSIYLAGTYHFSRAQYLEEGIGGNTTSLMLARIDPLLTSDVGGLVIEAGANDANDSITLTTYAANMTAMINKAKAKGIPVVLVTVPPKEASAPSLPGSRVFIDRYNTWIRLNAPRLGCEVADIWAVLASTTTGNLNPTYADVPTQHINDTGHFLIAQEVAAAMRRTTESQLTIHAAAQRPANLVANGFMTGAGTVPDGWASSSTGTAATFSIVTDTSGVLPGGRWFEAHINAAVASTVTISHLLTAGTWAVGDVLASTCIYQIVDVSTGQWFNATAAHTGYVVTGLYPSPSNTYITPSLDYCPGRTVDKVNFTLGPEWLTGTVPTGTTDMRFRPSFGVPAGANVKFRVGAVEVLNLTTLGMTTYT